jgi:exodeoxyribonuclease VII large subunit
MSQTPSAAQESTPAGIPPSRLPGPFPVGEYAAALRSQLRSFARVQLVGELVNLRPSRARVYFELRDATGAVPCAAWRQDWDQMVARAGAPQEGMQVVVGGGCDYYPGSATSSPGFSFTVLELRLAGDGDLLARIERLRKQLDAEGLLERQKLLPRPVLPRTIGVITGEGGKARDDVLAALARRGWAGRLVWGFAPVQDRHAAPAIVRALGDLTAVGGVDVAIVARGGGSLADLLCFCDETLCRTVALLGVPVIASVGHHTDRTLLDDVAAVSCSTPTHAAEEAVRVDCTNARAEQAAAAARLRDHGRRAVLSRARTLVTLSRAPSAHLERQRARLPPGVRAAVDRAPRGRVAAQGCVLGARLPRATTPRAGAARAGVGRTRPAADARARLRAGAIARRRARPHRCERPRGGRAEAALRRRIASCEDPRAMRIER